MLQRWRRNPRHPSSFTACNLVMRGLAGLPIGPRFRPRSPLHCRDQRGGVPCLIGLIARLRLLRSRRSAPPPRSASRIGIIPARPTVVVTRPAIVSRSAHSRGSAIVSATPVRAPIHSAIDTSHTPRRERPADASLGSIDRHGWRIRR
jgi:hypothetical protein